MSLHLQEKLFTNIAKRGIAALLGAMVLLVGSCTLRHTTVSSGRITSLSGSLKHGRAHLTWESRGAQPGDSAQISYTSARGYATTLYKKLSAGSASIPQTWTRYDVSYFVRAASASNGIGAGSGLNIGGPQTGRTFIPLRWHYTTKHKAVITWPVKGYSTKIASLTLISSDKGPKFFTRPFLSGRFVTPTLENHRIYALHIAVKGHPENNSDVVLAPDWLNSEQAPYAVRGLHGDRWLRSVIFSWNPPPHGVSGYALHFSGNHYPDQILPPWKTHFSLAFLPASQDVSLTVSSLTRDGKRRSPVTAPSPKVATRAGVNISFLLSRERAPLDPFQGDFTKLSPGPVPTIIDGRDGDMSHYIARYGHLKLTILGYSLQQEPILGSLVLFQNPSIILSARPSILVGENQKRLAFSLTIWKDGYGGRYSRQYDRYLFISKELFPRFLPTYPTDLVLEWQTGKQSSASFFIERQRVFEPYYFAKRRLLAPKGKIYDAAALSGLLYYDKNGRQIPLSSPAIWSAKGINLVNLTETPLKKQPHAPKAPGNPPGPVTAISKGEKTMDTLQIEGAMETLKSVY